MVIPTLADPPDFLTFGADLRYKFSCPLCGNQELDQTLGWFESNDKITCPNCKEVIVFDPKAIRDALRELREAARVLWLSMGYLA